MKIAMFALCAVIAYALGCFNGAILVSKTIFHEDIRQKGSGNAGLTNYYRTYGAKFVGVMMLIDIAKTVAAIFFGKFLFSHFLQMPQLGQYWAALFVVIGHCFPCVYQFRGGKGILCSGTMLCILDWRIALVGLGLFLVALLLTRYVSLGSVLAASSFPFTTWWVFRDDPQFVWIMAIAVFLAAFVIWAHRANILRLIKGTENKFRIHNGKEQKK